MSIVNIKDLLIVIITNNFDDSSKLLKFRLIDLILINLF